MQVHLRYQCSTHEINLPEKANVEKLQDEILKLLSIPKQYQKIIYRGRPLDKSTDDIIPNGAKLLLLETQSSTTKEDKKIPQEQNKNKNTLNDEILIQGVPKNVMKSYLNVNCSCLPKEPFTVMTEDGETNLSFETDALFFINNIKNERIFYNEIYSSKCIKIEETGYFILFVITRVKEYAFYYIPNQYYELIRLIVQSKGL